LEEERRVETDAIEQAAGIFEGFTRRWNTELDYLIAEDVYPFGKSIEVAEVFQVLARRVEDQDLAPYARKVAHKEITDVTQQEFAVCVRLVDAIKAADETLQRVKEVVQEILPSGEAAALALLEDWILLREQGSN
jgi:hypothetical protein